jgi:PKD repeat protein
MKQLNKYSWAVLLLLVIPLVFSCKKDEEADVIASFSWQIATDNFLKVTFTNTSQNYETVTWDFGDGQTSTDVSPVHIYSAAGTYTVKLTAVKSDKSDVYTQSVTLTDPNVMLTALVGENTKTWKLIHDVSTNVYPLEVGPIDRSQIWWAYGKQEEISKRPCMLNDEWTFGRDGSMVYAAHGDFWREGDGIFDPSGLCGVTTDMVGKTGEDLSAWGDGNHAFRLDVAKNKITAIGKGAFIGFYKTSTDCEV